MIRNQKQSGFTLIELVVVISIIAILSAVALPRYINLQTQARIAKLNAMYGSVKSAAALAHAGCLVDLAGLTTPTTCTVAGGTVSMEGASVAMTNQYPTANVTFTAGGGILFAAQITPTPDGLFISGGNPLLIDVGTAANPTCRFTYTSATAPLGVVTAPVIAAPITTGC